MAYETQHSLFEAEGAKEDAKQHDQHVQDYRWSIVRERKEVLTRIKGVVGLEPPQERNHGRFPDGNESIVIGVRHDAHPQTKSAVTRAMRSLGFPPHSHRFVVRK